jgi:hypothetical protein
MKKSELLRLNKKLNKFNYGCPYSTNTTLNYQQQKMQSYKYLSVEEMDKFKMGICWDFAHYYGVKVPTSDGILFVAIDKNGNIKRTHAFPIVKIRKTYFIAESSWALSKGLNKFSENRIELIKKYFEFWKNINDEGYTFSIYEYDCSDKSFEGLSADPWLGKIIGDNKCLKILTI